MSLQLFAIIKLTVKFYNALLYIRTYNVMTKWYCLTTSLVPLRSVGGRMWYGKKLLGSIKMQGIS
jgi:hypothetical protein